MRKLALLCVSLLMVSFLLVTPAAANEQAFANLSVEVNGEPIAFEEHGPILENGTTLIPAHLLFEALDITLEESDQEGAVLGVKEAWSVALLEGDLTASVNGEVFELLVAPRAIDEVTYVPVRFISEAAGYEVTWDAATRTVHIQSPLSLQGGRGFLWEVQHEGNTVYLLGSIHIADNSFYPLADAMEEAFAAADALAVEIDLTHVADPDIQALTLEKSMYQDGSSLPDHISEETYAKLGEVLTSLGLPADSFDPFKPWMVEMSLTMLKGQLSGLEASAGIDLYFLARAKEDQLPVIELESYESQLAMLDGFSAELQEANLSTLLEHFHEGEEAFDGLAQMWINGDDDILLSIIEETAANEEYYQAMLVNRNELMTEKIKSYLNSDEETVILVIVGAAHMLGESGIVTQLENDGYTVTKK